MSTKIALIGVGKMGKPVASHLLSAGYSLNLYNFTSSSQSMENINALVGQGANLAEDLAEFLHECRYVFSFLPTENAVRSVFLNQNFIDNLWKDTIIVDFSTVHPQVIIEIATLYKELGFVVIDCPVSGGVKKAELGNLTVYSSGNIKECTILTDIVSSFAENVFYIGDVGYGKLVKAANQLLIANNLLGVACVEVLLSEYSLSSETLKSIIENSSGASYAFKNYFDKLENNEFEPKFTIRQMRKDLDIVMKLLDGKSQFAQSIFSIYSEEPSTDDLDISAIKLRMN